MLIAIYGVRGCIRPNGDELQRKRPDSVGIAAAAPDLSRARSHPACPWYATAK
jgi:hypothetical protein